MTWGGEADRGWDHATVGSLVSLEIRVDLKPGLVHALYDVLYNSVVSKCVPPLVERYPARVKSDISQMSMSNDPPDMLN